MLSLKNIQSTFWAAISQIKPGEEVSDLELYLDPDRLAIYRNTIITAHVNALEMSYPKTLSILGSRLFNGLAKGYFFHHLPRSPNLNDFGNEFPQWLKIAAKEVDKLKQLDSILNLEQFSQLEWALEQGYFSEDRQFSETDLKRLQQHADSTAFQFHPSVECFCFKRPVSRLLSKDIEKVDQNTVIELPHQLEYLIVFRDQWQMKFEIIDEIYFLHTKWIESGLDYYSLQNQVGYQEAVIAGWIQQGIISNTIPLK